MTLADLWVTPFLLERVLALPVGINIVGIKAAFDPKPDGAICFVIEGEGIPLAEYEIKATTHVHYCEDQTWCRTTLDVQPSKLLTAPRT